MSTEGPKFRILQGSSDSGYPDVYPRVLEVEIDEEWSSKSHQP